MLSAPHLGTPCAFMRGPRLRQAFRDSGGKMDDKAAALEAVFAQSFLSAQVGQGLFDEVMGCLGERETLND